MATAAGLGVLIAVLWVWQLLHDGARDHVNAVTEEANHITELLIREDVNNRLAAINRLAERWNAVDGTPRSGWDSDAASYVRDMPGFQAIEWADRSLHIRWVVPLIGNEVAQDLYIGEREPAKSTIAEARINQKAVLTKPRDLIRGERGITAYAPVTRGDDFDGLIIGDLRLEPWIHGLLTRMKFAEHYARVLLEGEEIYRSDTPSPPPKSEWTATQDFDVHGLTWTTEVTPSAEFIAAQHSRTSDLVLIVGILFSLLVAMSVYLAKMARVRARQLHDTTSQLSALFQNLPGMAYRCIYDPKSPMEFVSEGCEQLSGYARRDFEERRVLWGDLIHPDDREQVWQGIRAAVDAKAAFDTEYRILTTSDDECWVWERGRAVYSDGSNVIHLEGIISDITDRKRAESELFETRAFSEAVVDTAAEAVITIGFNGTVETFNRAAQQMFDYSLDDVRGRNVSMLMPEPFQTEHDSYIKRYLDTDEARIIGTGREARAQRRDGSIFPIHLSVSEIHSHFGRKFVALIRDISQQRAAEKAAREHLEQLAHVDRLNMLGEMATGIAHEINQPLTAISLFSQAGKRLLDVGNANRLPEIFDKLSQHALRAGDIIERMQSMARRGESARESADCNSLVEEVAKLAEAEARIRDIAIKLELGAGMPKVVVDIVQIQQVALNLLRNGMEAMRSIDCRNGNTITLQTKLRQDGDIEVVVVDSGCGVTEEVAGKIFTPFSTTKDSGMGMGLSLSRNIVTAHGGQLAFQNNKAGGATFYFTLPVGN